MTSMRLVLLTIFTLVCVSVTYAQDAVSLADCSEAKSAENYELWAIMLVEDCDPLPKQLDLIVDSLAELIAVEGSLSLQNKVDVLSALREQVLTLNSRHKEASKRSIEAFALALQCDIHQLNNSNVNEDSQNSNIVEECKEYTATGDALRRQKWQTLDSAGSAYKNIFIDVLDTLAPECFEAAVSEASDCHLTMTQQFVPVLEFYSIMSNVVLPAVNKDVKNEIAARYKTNQLRWKSYVQDTGFQYPWELVFNKRRHGGYPEVALGRPAPKQRWVLLHPTAGLYHSEELPDGDQTALLGIVKIIGMKRWNYDGENKPKNIIGLSLTTTFADLAGIEDVGYGIMADYKGFSLGINRHGSEQLIVVNIELQNLLSARPRSFRQWLTAVGG